MSVPNQCFPQQVNPCMMGMPQQMVYQPDVQMPMQQMPRRNFLNGRFVNSENEIYPNEVPMDGNRYYFPSVDESAIIVKYWDQNSMLVTKKYVEASNTQNVTNSKDDFNELKRRIEKLEKVINRNNSEGKRGDNHE